MDKEFIPYELALELKQIGFDEPCLATIDQTDFIHIKGTEYPIRGAMIYDTIDCPTYSQAFRWFREKHNLYHMLNPFTRGEIIEGDLVESMCFGYAIQDEVIGETDFKTYEEAELECLKHLIFIVKAAQGFDHIL